MNLVFVVDDPRSDCTYFDQIIEGFLELLAKFEQFFAGGSTHLADRCGFKGIKVGAAVKAM